MLQDAARGSSVSPSAPSSGGSVRPPSAGSGNSSDSSSSSREYTARPRSNHPFDPYEEADRVRERERRKVQTNAAYKELYGSPTGNKKPIDPLLNIGDQLRGTLGGMFGPLFGSLIDVVSAFRKTQVDEEKEKYTRQLLDEAKTTTGILKDIRTAIKPPGSPVGGKPATKPGQPAGAGKGISGEDLIHDSAYELHDLGLTPEEEARLVDSFKMAPVDEAASGIDGDVFKMEPLDNSSKPLKKRDTPHAKPEPINKDVYELADEIPVVSPAEIPTVYPAAAEGVGAAEAGGMMGMLGAAAGPAAIAVAAIAVRDTVNKAIIGGIRSSIGSVSGIVNSIASPNSDPSVSISAAGNAASIFGEKIAAISPVLGWMTVGIGETTKALGGLMQELDKTATRYGDYSPEIAQQQGLAEVRFAMGELRRSQEVGPELARYVQTQSELTQKFEDIKVKLLTQILKVLNPILEILEATVPSGDSIDLIVGALNPLDTLARAAAQLVGIQMDDRLPDVVDPTSVLINNPFGQGVGAAPIPGDLGR